MNNTVCLLSVEIPDLRECTVAITFGMNLYVVLQPK